MKIATIVGARPQFIKAATVSRLFRKRRRLREILIHTGQHYDRNMSDIFFRQLDLSKPDYHLGVGSLSHAQQTACMLERIEQVLIKEKPQCVIVYGDTNSTIAGALAAAKLNIPVTHIEAGLRSFNRVMPEEMNRVVTDHLSDLLFTPTQTAIKNLKNEGISAKKIFPVGDVMYDAALFYAQKAEKASCILRDLNIMPKNYVLATIHRAENTDSPMALETIFQSLCMISKKIPVIFPVHPRTKKILGRKLVKTKAQNDFHCISPVGYLDMIHLEKNARAIVTDSGGIQKEAFFYRVPAVTIRTETEWTETVRLGWNQIVPPRRSDDITQKVLACFARQGRISYPYGRGDAAQKILIALLQRFH